MPREVVDVQATPENGAVPSVEIPSQSVIEQEGAIQEKTAIQQEQVNTPLSRAPEQPVKPLSLLKTENLLAERLEELYASLNSETQVAFKQKGEEIAVVITQLAESGKLTAEKVLKLIREWLKLIPGVNKFFLEQEAKIKTDAVMDAFRESPNQNEL